MKKKLKLKCADIKTLPELHSALRTLLELPDYYGNNFDALYDCLTEIGVPTRLEVRDLKKSGLGDKATIFRKVLVDADRNNPNFNVIFTRTIFK